MTTLTLPPMAAAVLGTVERPTTPAEVLRLMVRLLEVPARWTQDDLARDDADEPLTPCHAAACCWCVVGALILLTGGHSRAGELYTPLYWATTALLECATGTDDIPEWQDAHTHAEVLAMLRDALALAETP